MDGAKFWATVSRFRDRFISLFSLKTGSPTWPNSITRKTAYTLTFNRDQTEVLAGAHGTPAPRRGQAETSSVESPLSHPPGLSRWGSHICPRRLSWPAAAHICPSAMGHPSR